MRIHSAEKIKELKRLRERGYSINELVAELFVPKTTVWHHVHNIRVLPKYIPILNAKRGGNQKRMQRNLEIARKHAYSLLDGPIRELAIAAAMLYWGEGSKKKCEFINSDGKMIKSYLTMMKKVFNIPEERIKLTIRIFSGIDKEECLNYWSRVTRIPKNKFIIWLNDGGTRGRMRYGMCRISIKRGGDILKSIHSIIDQFSAGIASSHN